MTCQMTEVTALQVRTAHGHANDVSALPVQVVQQPQRVRAHQRRVVLSHGLGDIAAPHAPARSQTHFCRFRTCAYM